MPDYPVYRTATRNGVSFRVFKPERQYPWRRRPVATITALSVSDAVTKLRRLVQDSLPAPVADQVQAAGRAGR